MGKNGSVHVTTRDEHARVEDCLKTKKYLDEPNALPWYHKNPPKIDPETLDLLENYSEIASTDVLHHIKKVRDEAFKLHPYPCLGNWHFLNIGATQNPVYDEVLERVKKGQQFLDLGCCFAQDIRKLAHDGAPSENLTGSDLTRGFWDISYDLFRDQAVLKSKFIEADIFDAASNLRDIDGQIDILQASSFFHLFDRDAQAKAIKKVIQLMKPLAGVMVIGRQLGLSQAGENTIFMDTKMYMHNPESWAELWKEVGDETDTKWDVAASLSEEDLSKQTQAFIPKGTKYLVFSVRRL